jgi:hypothetical protein
VINKAAVRHFEIEAAMDSIIENMQTAKEVPAPIKPYAAPVREVPASQNVPTKPAPYNLTAETIEPANYIFSDEVEKPIFNEIDEYIIRSYKLEYWLGDDDNQTK